MQTHYKQLTDLQWQIIKKILPTQRRRKHDLSHRSQGLLWRESFWGCLVQRTPSDRYGSSESWKSKFWPTVSCIDSTYSDRKLMCGFPVEEYAEWGLLKT